MNNWTNGLPRFENQNKGPLNYFYDLYLTMNLELPTYYFYILSICDFRSRSWFFREAIIMGLVSLFARDSCSTYFFNFLLWISNSCLYFFSSSSLILSFYSSLLFANYFFFFMYSSFYISLSETLLFSSS